MVIAFLLVLVSKPFGPLLPLLVLLGIFLQRCFEPLLRLSPLARCPSHLQDSSSKYLCLRVEVVLAGGDCGEKLVGVMIVVPALESIDNSSNKFPNLLWGGLGGLNPIKGSFKTLLQV